MIEKNIDYVFSQELNIYTRPNKTGIGYADGGESKILKILTQISDKSVFSEELLPFLDDWPTEYHLSRKRHLICRPLDIKPGDKVLELGCGCGAITRYLAEIGADVTAVEGEVSRAVVAAKRCQEFSNVRFYVDDILDLNLEEKFDWVLMIGVFEYSQKFGRSSNKQADYLNQCKRYLSSTGTLVIAIENKLGIKYLNGAGEDHNSQSFYGTQDLYSGKDVTTWGKSELQEILKSSGFYNQNFFGVFPDYKLPKVIFNEKLNELNGFRAEEILLFSKSLDYSGQNSRLFDEPLALASFRKNGLLIDVANSFLILAKTSQLEAVQIDHPIAYYFSINRKKEFCTQTKFVSDENQFFVEKEYIFNAFAQDPDAFSVEDFYGSKFKLRHLIDHHRIKYLDGSLLAFDFSKALKRNDLFQVGEIIKKWMRFLTNTYVLYDKDSGQRILLENLKNRKLSSVMVDGEALDCGPQNIINAEVLSTFDLEWISKSPIPLAWVLTRNCNHIYRQSFGGEQLFDLNSLIGLASEYLEIEATTNDVENSFYLEATFQNYVSYDEPSNSNCLK